MDGCNRVENGHLWSIINYLIDEVIGSVTGSRLINFMLIINRSMNIFVVVVLDVNCVMFIFAHYYI